METYWGAGDKALGVGGAGKRQQYHLIKIIYHIVSIILVSIIDNIYFD